MAQGRRAGFSAEQEANIWCRWKAGQSLHLIGRAYGKEHTSIHSVLSNHGALACRAMTMEVQRPRLLVPIVVVICSGTLACISAFFTRRFALLFLSAGSVSVLVLFYLYHRWWPGLPLVRGRSKIYRGIAILAGFLIFACTRYIMVWLDPSLKHP